MNKAVLLQKWFWHLRWILLIGIMVYNGFGLLHPIDLEHILLVNGVLFAIHFFCKQLEGYFECKSKCLIRRSEDD